MTQESQAIEVEVVAIDNAAPAVASEAAAESNSAPWQNWRGRTLKLDGYWWPVWVILGVLAVFLLLTVGVVLGAIYVIFRILRGLIRALIR